MAIRLADTARPNNHVDAEHLGTFPVAYAEDVWFEDGTRLSEKTFEGQSIQKEELPLASADESGNIYQYVGADGTYKNGRFYICKYVGGSNYSWSEIPMVTNPVVYSETIPLLSEYNGGAIVCYTGENSGDFAKGHLYQKNETSFTYYYWTFYRDSAKTQPYIFYTREETLANGVNVYQANPTTGEGNISLVGSISNYQEFSFFVNGSSSVQYFHPEADTSKNRTGTEGNWIDIGGGNAVGGIIDVETLPTSDIKNTFYRTKEDVGGKIRTIEVSLTSAMSFDEKVAYLSQYFIVHPDQANNRIDIETYPDLYMTRASWTKHYSVPENTLALMYLDTERIELNWDADNTGTPQTETSMVMPLLFSSSHFPSAVYYAGDEINQTTERMATYEDIPKEFIGTQAEWDNLTADEKSEYTIVNITDDTNTNGKFIDITSQCTVVLGTAKVMKCGQIVVINGYNSKMSGSNGFRTTITGVPKPISNGTSNSAYGSTNLFNSNGGSMIAKVNDSTVSVYCSTSYAQEYTIMYLTDE